MFELLCIPAPTDDNFSVKSITKVLDVPLTNYYGVMCRKNQMLYMSPGAAINGSIRYEWYGFDTDSDILTTLKPSSYGIYATHAALVGEFIYLLGGTNQLNGGAATNGIDKIMWRYNPETDAWSGMQADDTYTLSTINDYTFEYEGFLNLHLNGTIYRSTRPSETVTTRRAWVVYAETGNGFYSNADISHYLDGDDLYMFGGMVNAVNKRVGKFNLITKTWVDVTEDYGFFPSTNGRAAVFKFRNSFVIIPDQVGTTNNKNIYKLTKGKAPEIIGQLPFFARGASFEMVGNHIYMHGGVTTSTGTYASSQKALHRIELD